MAGGKNWWLLGPNLNCKYVSYGLNIVVVVLFDMVIEFEYI